MKQHWIIATCNTAGDGVLMEHAMGTKEEIKKRLVNEAMSWNKEYSGRLEGLPNNIDDIKDDGDYLFIGPWGSDFHIDICAEKLCAIKRK